VVGPSTRFMARWVAASVIGLGVLGCRQALAAGEETGPREDRVGRPDGAKPPPPGPPPAKALDRPLAEAREDDDIGRGSRRRTSRGGGREGFPGPGKIGPPRGRLGPGRHGGHRRMPSETQIEEGMAFLKEHWSERHTLMEQLRIDDPEAFGLAFRNMWPQLARMIELCREYPELGQIEVALVKVEFKVLRATRAYHAASKREDADPTDPSENRGPAAEDGREALLAELETAVGERFDLQIKRSELRIQQLADQLTQQRERLEEQRRNKQEEVADVVKRLTSKRFSPRHLRGMRSRGLRGKPRDRHRPGTRGDSARGGQFGRDLSPRTPPPATKPAE